MGPSIVALIIIGRMLHYEGSKVTMNPKKRKIEKMNQSIPVEKTKLPAAKSDTGVHATVRKALFASELSCPSGVVEFDFSAI